MNGRNRKLALQSLSIAIFLLFSAPKMSIKVGSLPIYAIDFLIMLANIFAFRFKSKNNYPYMRWIIIFILINIFLSEFISGIRMSTLLKPIYIIFRMFLAGSLFFITFKLIKNFEDLQKILKSALMGSFITAILLILTSLPFTRPLITPLFSLSFLEPVGEEIIERFSWYTKGIRGQALIGVSIISGSFLNIIWPFLIFLYSSKRLSRIWSYFLLLTIILIPLAAVMTYSRGVILGVILMLIGILVFHNFKIKFLTIFVALCSLMFFSYFGWDSEYFFFSRIENRLQATLTNPYEDERETERILAYSEPFHHLASNPIFFIQGQGFARNRIKDHNLREGYGVATHALFAAAYYGYGLFTSLAYVSLLVFGFSYTISWVQKRKNRGGLGHRFSRAVLISLIGLLPWFAFGHAAVSMARGAMLFFFLFGLVALQKNFFITNN